MATVRLISEEEATGAIREYFASIKARYNMSWVPNLARAMANFRS